MTICKIDLGYNLKDKELKAKLCELISDVSRHIESNLKTNWDYFSFCKDCFCDKNSRTIDDLTRVDGGFVEYIISAVKEKIESDKANDILFVDSAIEEDFEDSLLHDQDEREQI